MILPSRMDNLPQTGTEAISSGCPVVAFRCGGMESVVRHEVTGYLARPYDTLEFGKAVETLYLERGKRNLISKNARKYAENYWSEPVVATQYLELFNNLI